MNGWRVAGNACRTIGMLAAFAVGVGATLPMPNLLFPSFGIWVCMTVCSKCCDQLAERVNP